ncbi:MAG: hypothetical protein WD772_04720 [Pseudohongiellaceae bacterium]
MKLESQFAFKLRPNRVAAVAVTFLGCYLQLVEWVDLYPWNDVRSGNGQETLDLILAGATLVLVMFLWFGGRSASILASVGLTAWFWLQFSTWWIPYVAGTSPGWKRVYQQWFAETVQILPRTEANLPPDANHIVLHVLIVLALIASLRAVFQKASV